MPGRKVFITLGSNIDPEKHLQAAVYLLGDEADVDVIGVSRVYRSKPLDKDGEVNPDQDDYLNAAVLVETDLPILDLKQDILRRIEARLERVRTQDKYAPRTIDLDVVLYGDEILGLIIEELDTGKQYILPDPDITRFAHVALPLRDLDAGYVHPVTGQTLGEIAGRFEGKDTVEVDPIKLEF